MDSVGYGIFYRTPKPWTAASGLSSFDSIIFAVAMALKGDPVAGYGCSIARVIKRIVRIKKDTGSDIPGLGCFTISGCDEGTGVPDKGDITLIGKGYARCALSLTPDKTGPDDGQITTQGFHGA